MKKTILTGFTSLALLFGTQAQTTVTITATGAAGSFNTGSVNSLGTKNDGNMISINTSTAGNAGWAKFNLTSLPAGAIVTAATCVFTTYTTTSSGATNNLYGFIGDPAVITGTVLYTNCNTGTSLNASTWTANAINTKTLNATGVNFVGSNVSSNQLCIGYSRGSTNNYNIYGYPGTTGSQPMLVITYLMPCSGTPNAGTAVASTTTLCSPSNVNLNLTGSTNAVGLSYQWLSSSNGTTWNPISTATTIATTQSVTATTYYQCAVACGTNVALSSVITVSLTTAIPFAGTISGATTVNNGSTNSYTVSPTTGNIQWYSGSTSTGPWSPISSATVAINQTITAVGSGTVFYTTIASSVGCPNDTSNIPLAVTIIFLGDNVCAPIALTTGTSSVYALLGATTQTGEVVPISGGCSTNNTWCNSILDNTMWFTFVAPASGNISVQSPGFDTQLAIWSATNCANLIGQATPTAPVGATLVAANDDDASYISHAGSQYSSYVRAACLTPGKTYYIQLDSYSPATSTDITTIIITDLGAMNTSFTGVNPTYCLPTTSSSLTPATSGGLFTVNSGTTAVTSFSPTSAGSYTVTYSIFGCVSNSTTIVNITPTVSAIPSSSAICAGSSATVTASGATTYSWSPSATLSSSTGSVVVASPTVTASYTITGYNGVCSNSSSGTLVVNPVPSLTVSPASTTICPGNTITLTASGSTTYTWSNAATTATTSVSPSSLTVYTVTSTTSCGSSTATASVNVSSVVSIVAASSSSLLCSGQSATLTANGASSYTWMPAGSGTSIVVTPTTTTTYTVMGSSSCGSASVTVTQNVSLCTGVAEALVSSEISLYPNPNYGVVTIELASELIQNTSILIYDALGKIVISEKLITEITTVKTAHLDNGVYFYKVISNNKDVKVGKLVKQ